MNRLSMPTTPLRARPAVLPQRAIAPVAGQPFRVLQTSRAPAQLSLFPRPALAAR